MLPEHLNDIAEGLEVLLNSMRGLGQPKALWAYRNAVYAVEHLLRGRRFRGIVERLRAPTANLDEVAMIIGVEADRLRYLAQSVRAGRQAAIMTDEYGSCAVCGVEPSDEEMREVEEVLRLFNVVPVGRIL